LTGLVEKIDSVLKKTSKMVLGLRSSVFLVWAGFIRMIFDTPSLLEQTPKKEYVSFF